MSNIKAYNGLNDRQSRFVDEYLVDSNATQAAIRAGYSEKTANPMAARLLANVSIEREIEAKRKRLQIKTEVKSEQVIQEYARIAFSNTSDYLTYDEDGVYLIPSSKLSKAHTAAIKGIRFKRTSSYDKDGECLKVFDNVELLFHDKIAALAALAKHLGIQGVDKHEIDMNVTDNTRDEFTRRIARLAERQTTESLN